MLPKKLDSHSHYGTSFWAAILFLFLSTGFIDAGDQLKHTNGFDARNEWGPAGSACLTEIQKLALKWNCGNGKGIGRA